MTIREYIDKNLPNLNWNILPQIFEDNEVELTEEIEKYLRETPENTNWNIIDSIMNSGGGNTGEVWFVGSEYYDEDGTREFYLLNVGETDHKTELLTNHSDYDIFLNGEELPFSVTPQEGFIIWTDTEVEETTTKVVRIIQQSDEIQVTVVFLDASTAPTSVEISVSIKGK